MYGLHRGYQYQDILGAILVAENLHNLDLEFAMELKESNGDLFDDIVVIAQGKKKKIQVKHTSVGNSLARTDFETSSSDLLVSKLAKSFADDSVDYLILTNRVLCVDSCFTEIKNEQISSIEHKSYKLKLNVERKFLKKLTICTSLPEFSRDLSSPGDMEKVLLETLRDKVGVGYYPNDKSNVVDVAARLILFVSNLKGEKSPQLVGREAILTRLGLNSEYGHIAQNFPFISPEYRVFRDQLVKKLVVSLDQNKVAILKGHPGSGKSHIFDDLSDEISNKHKLVAKHFCYLEPTDQFAQNRVVVDAMYGNFLHQLERLVPEIVKDMRPYFAATKTNLEKALQKIADSGQAVVLMIDGLDHLNRVVAQNKLAPDLVPRFMTDILNLKIPDGSALFIASQPSKELDSIIRKNKAEVHELPLWSESLVKDFMLKHNEQLPSHMHLDVGKNTVNQLTEKTEGNALYLTYVIKEFLASSSGVALSEFIQTLPVLNKNLNHYYEYLLKDSTDQDIAIVQTLALLDFSVSEQELIKMFPPIQKKVVIGALNKIKSVLKPGVAQVGIRIYHESFRRFMIDFSHSKGQDDRELYEHIVSWLEKEDFYLSQRSYRYLLPYLIRSDVEDKAEAIITEDFMAKSLFYFHSLDSIRANLNKIAGFAAQKQNWPFYCKAVELKRAFHTFSEERADSLDETYYEAVLQTHGVAMFCERLLFDGKPVFSKSKGIVLCQLAEHKKGNPPWDFYDVSGVSMNVGDETSVYTYQKVQAAHYLNIIRNASKEYALKILKKMLQGNSYPGTEQRHADMLLEEFDYVFDVSENYKDLIALNVSVKKKDCLRLTVAKYLWRGSYKKLASQLSTDTAKNTSNLEQLERAIAFKCDKSQIQVNKDIADLTKKVMSIEYPGDKESVIFKEWYGTLIIVAYIDREKARKAKKIIDRYDGWYRAWLSYIFELALIETSNKSKHVKQVELKNALKSLADFTYPFRGKPRAMDLYSLREQSADTFRRTLRLANDFSNFNEIISLLSRISSETTSYLQGSSDGPLSGESYNDLLKEAYAELNPSNQQIVRKLLEDNIQEGIGTSIYYDSSSYELLKLVDVLALNKKSKKSRECFMNACIHLVAYGHRKDVTLFEIIEPLNFIAKKDLSFAIDCYKKLYPLIETVWRHTDGKETKWALVYWIKDLVDADPRIAIQALLELHTQNPKKDWRVEDSIEYLCEQLLNASVDPVLIRKLYETINQLSNTMIDVEPGLKIAGALTQSGHKAEAKELFDRLCWTLDFLHTYEHISEKEKNFAKMTKFSRDHNLKINDQHKTMFAGISGVPASPDIPAIPKPRVQSVGFHGKNFEQLKRMIDENNDGNFLAPVNVTNLGRALVKLNDESATEILSLIARQSVYKDNAVEGLVTLSEFFSSKNRKGLFACASMLCFMYARGGGGWHAFADSKYNHLASNALRSDQSIAKKVMASEATHLFYESSYFTGPVRHLIEFFATHRSVGTAKAIWEEAYNVIKYRLPMDQQLEILLANQTPPMNINRRKSLPSLVMKLTEARASSAIS